MSIYLEKYKKNIVIDMRKKGFSYSEIQNSIHIPKSTIAYWLRDVKLTSLQIEKLKNKIITTAKTNSEKKKLKTRELIEKIKSSSSDDIGKISKRELWLMGIVLYWREKLLLNKDSDLKKGINFTSSDPYLIKLFLKWLKEAGEIKSDEILFDIFTKTNKIERINQAISYWSELTGASPEDFSRIYFKKLPRKTDEKRSSLSSRKSKFGLLRIRVRASSMLARQMAGWMRGISGSL